MMKIDAEQGEYIRSRLRECLIVIDAAVMRCEAEVDRASATNAASLHNAIVQCMYHLSWGCANGSMGFQSAMAVIGREMERQEP